MDCGLQLGCQVDEAGRPIGQPPLHIHHAFLNLESSGSQHHTTDTRACLLLGRRCPGGAAMFAGAADFEQLQRVFSMRLTVEEPLNARAMVNDARPRGSAPMRWYVQLSLRTSAGRCEARISPHISHISPISPHISQPPNVLVSPS